MWCGFAAESGGLPLEKWNGVEIRVSDPTDNFFQRGAGSITGSEGIQPRPPFLPAKRAVSEGTDRQTDRLIFAL